MAFDCCFSLILAADLRFIEQSRSSINGRHKSLETSLGEDISSLQKKQKYYDRQVEEANGQLRDIVSLAVGSHHYADRQFRSQSREQ